MPYKYSSKTQFILKIRDKRPKPYLADLSVLSGDADELPMNADPVLQNTHDITYPYGCQESSRFFLFLLKINSPNISWEMLFNKKAPVFDGGFVSLLVLISGYQISVCVVFRRPVPYIP